MLAAWRRRRTPAAAPARLRTKARAARPAPRAGGLYAGAHSYVGGCCSLCRLLLWSCREYPCQGDDECQREIWRQIVVRLVVAIAAKGIGPHRRAGARIECVHLHPTRRRGETPFVARGTRTAAGAAAAINCMRVGGHFALDERYSARA